MSENLPVEVTPKSVFLSAIYIVLLIVFLFLLDIGLEWFFNNVMFGVIDWFNSLGLILKILLIVFGGAVFVYALLSAFSIVAFFVNQLLLSWFPMNKFNIVASSLLTFANAVWAIVTLWKFPEGYNIWIVLELLLLSYFILLLNNAMAMRKTKEM